jgi:mRNA interferase RelE/StbE
MASYSLRIVASLEKDLKRIDKKWIPRLYEAINSLAENPFPTGQCRKIQGSEHSYRIRVGEYRILYEVNREVRIVSVYRVRHRRDAYR